MDRFAGMMVEDDGVALVGRNVEGRVLFRYNRWSTDFGIFRSSRMTVVEKDLVLLQMDRLFEGKVPDLEEKKTNVRRFLDYETDQDTFCS